MLSDSLDIKRTSKKYDECGPRGRQGVANVRNQGSSTLSIAKYEKEKRITL